MWPQGPVSDLPSRVSSATARGEEAPRLARLWWWPVSARSMVTVSGWDTICAHPSSCSGSWSGSRTRGREGGYPGRCPWGSGRAAEAPRLSAGRGGRRLSAPAPTRCEASSLRLPRAASALVCGGHVPDCQTRGCLWVRGRDVRPGPEPLGRKGAGTGPQKPRCQR